LITLALAAAATCTQPLVEIRQMLPGTGETNVALNAIALVTYEGTSPVLANPGLAIEDMTGTIVPSTTTELPAPGPDRHVFVVVPNAPLAPLTQYVVADSVNWSCTAEPCSTALTPEHQFTTGSSSDTTAPPVPPAPMVATQMADVCADASCCGPYHTLVTSLANPATGAIRYDLYDGTTRVETNTPFLLRTDCAEAGDVAYPSPQDSVPLAAGVHHLTFHGFDESGNESVGTQALDVDLECSQLAPDAGTGPGTSDKGCGCHVGGTRGATPGVFALVALLMALRRKRR
jgi:MYXO-CTERM domain-containing protein